MIPFDDGVLLDLLTLHAVQILYLIECQVAFNVITDTILDVGSVVGDVTILALEFLFPKQIYVITHVVAEVTHQIWDFKYKAGILELCFTAEFTHVEYPTAVGLNSPDFLLRTII